MRDAALQSLFEFLFTREGFPDNLWAWALLMVAFFPVFIWGVFR